MRDFFFVSVGLVVAVPGADALVCVGVGVGVGVVVLECGLCGAGRDRRWGGCQG